MKTKKKIRSVSKVTTAAELEATRQRDRAERAEQGWRDCHAVAQEKIAEALSQTKVFQKQAFEFQKQTLELQSMHNTLVAEYNKVLVSQNELRNKILELDLKLRDRDERNRAADKAVRAASDLATTYAAKNCELRSQLAAAGVK